MLTLLVDFNTDRDGRARGLEREAVGGETNEGALALLDEGALALLDDGEGNQALGTVQRVEDGVVFADVDWSSWGRIAGRTVVVVELTEEPVITRSFHDELLQPAV